VITCNKGQQTKIIACAVISHEHSASQYIIFSAIENSAERLVRDRLRHGIAIHM
jgi:hypothetical protein